MTKDHDDVNFPSISKREYHTIHVYLNRHYPKKKKCEMCGITGQNRYELALIKGRTYSRKISDYMELCVSCHRKYDITDSMKMKASKRMRDLPRQLRGQIKPVFMIDIKTGITLKEFDSITSAMEYLGKTSRSIFNCLSGRSKKAFGYRWEYKKDQTT